MFGYVRPFKPELRVCEYEAYKSVYCALCKALGKEYGAAARFSLSYDGAFLALLGISLSQECITVQGGHCTCNPLKKCSFLCGAEQSLSLAAAVTVLLTYHKILDDIADRSFFGGIKARLLLPWASRWQKKAALKYPELAEQISGAMRSQKAAETEPEPSLDRCAEPSAQALKAIFLHLSAEEQERRILQEIGYHLGRWVYLMDASDDLPEDLKKQQFNPLIQKFSLSQESSQDQIREARNYMNEVLNASAARIVQAAALLGFRRLEPIISNIFTQGLSDAQRRVLAGEWKKQKARL
ncbi:MAG: DUF5685 family protein [Firmicutes bacterium]|nr:DUF5685 family protein [Bacillota bacterium]